MGWYGSIAETTEVILLLTSFCGVFGMKSSFGMISLTGVFKTTDSLDISGFVDAHANSLRPVLDIARVKGPNYPYVYQNVDRK
jgi:Asp-tRNA(Asn)/Glu-tRNA(Gln) amidotransferase A subunit family amidase